MGATGRDLHIDVPLSEVAINYRPKGFIADLIAPIVNVQKQSDSYLIWSKADAFRVEQSLRSPGTNANIITRSVSSGTFYCKNYALKTNLTLEDHENMDDAYIYELREGKAKFLTSKLQLGWEKRLVNLCTSTSNVGSSSTVTSDWIESATTKSDPVGDVLTAIRNVEYSTGFRPNRIVMGDLAWGYFRRHADVIGNLFGNALNPKSQSRFASIEGVKALFELDEFLIGRAFENTAEEGQSATMSSLWSDYVLVYYAPMTPSREDPSFMYSMRWAKAGIPNMQAEVYPYDPKTKSEEIEVGYYQAEEICASELSFLLTHVTSV